MQRSAVEILFATLGLIIGLFISVMASIYSRNDWKYDIKSSSTAYYYIIAMLFRFPIWFKKRDEMLMFLPENMARSMSKSNISAVPKLLDTSAIIDGRILDVIRCGFIDGEILIPQGVINELQVVADANDSVKREKDNVAWIY